MTSPAALAAAGVTPDHPLVPSGEGAALLRHLLFGAGLEMVEAIAMADETETAIQDHVSDA